MRGIQTGKLVGIALVAIGVLVAFVFYFNSTDESPAGVRDVTLPADTRWEEVVSLNVRFGVPMSWRSVDASTYTDELLAGREVDDVAVSGATDVDAGDAMGVFDERFVRFVIGASDGTYAPNIIVVDRNDEEIPSRTIIESGIEESGGEVVDSERQQADDGFEADVITYRREFGTLPIVQIAIFASVGDGPLEIRVAARTRDEADAVARTIVDSLTAID